MRVLALVVAMVGAACSGGAVSPPDASDGPEADATGDGATCGDCDAGPADAPTCAALEPDTRPVRTVELFEDGARIHAGRTFRVAIGYDATPCELFAMPTWSVTAATHVVGITANVFAPRALCPGLPIRRTRVIALRLEAGSWRLVGAGAAVPPQLMVTVGPAPLEPCALGTGACSQDCDCPTGQRCLAGVGLGGPFTQCARTCEFDRDCGGGQCTSIPDGLQQTCDDTLDECGGPGASCPSGFSCQGRACAPDFTLSMSTRRECTCDADCGAPLRCIGATVPGRTARCEIPCPSAGAWCQGAHACGPAAADLSGLASSDSVCGWLGE